MPRSIKVVDSFIKEFAPKQGVVAASWDGIKKALVEGQKPTTNTRIMQILKDARENELKVLPWECTSDTVKRYQDMLNALYELVVQNQHNA